MLPFFITALGILSDYLKAAHNKTANTVGNDIAAVDQFTLAILQENARIKGAVIDWADPAAVQAFVATLPAFTPIPEPAQDLNQTKGK